MQYRTLLLILFLMFSITIAQEEFIALRKTANVTTSASLDNNGNKIEDILDEKINKNPEGRSRIIVSVDKLSDQIEEFKSSSGDIVHTYEHAIQGFAGEIQHKNIPRFAGKVKNLQFIEEDKPTALHLDKSVRIIRARNVTWNNGFKGYPNFSIAVLDTGFDDSHPDLLGFQNASFNSTAKIIGWKDTTADNEATPVDFNDHGTHVASTALGTGASYGNASVTNTTTTFSFTLPTAGFCFVDKFEVQNPGTITLNGTVGSGKFVMQLRTPAGSLIASDSTAPWFIQHTTSTTGMWQAWGCNPAGPSGRPFSIIENYPYSAIGDGSNLFTGVAPNSRLTGVKIFRNDGSGLVSDMIEGFDWIIANKLVYRIKVASMSAGLANGATSTTLRSAANNVVANGIAFTVSAGNDFPDFKIGDPALAEKVIAVGATNDDDQMTDYSSNGPAGSGKPDVVAPGGSFNVKTQITAADTNDNDAGVQTFADYNPNDYTNLIGTSMSTPHAGGEAALIVQALGIWNYTEQEALKVKSIILMTAVETNAAGEAGNNPSLDRGGKDLVEGYGRINVDAAIEAITLNHSIGSNESAFLGAGVDKRVWARKISLTANTAYEFNLTSPGDFDLYLYDSNPDSIGNPLILNKSVSSTGNEFLTITPNATKEYFVAVKRVSGSGQFNLSSKARAQRIISITLIGFPVNFTNANPNTTDNQAKGNYTIKINPETNVNVSIHQKANDFAFSNFIIGVENTSWNLINNSLTSSTLKRAFDLIASNKTANTSVTLFYWIDVPSDQTGGDYNSTIIFLANETA